jgi:CheY-like chemotaxis protein
VIPIALAIVAGALAIALAFAIRELRMRRREHERLRAEVLSKTRAFERAEVALVHAERQSMMARVAAGVAHEVNNPAGLILAHLDQLSSHIPRGDEVASRGLADSIDGVRRIRAIVSALNDLTRDDACATEATTLHGVIEAALLVGAPSIARGVGIERSLEKTPAFESRPGTIMRVVLDLVAHAADSIGQGESGVVRVRARRDGELAVVEVVDDAPRSENDNTERRSIGLEVARQSVRSLGGVLSVVPNGDGAGLTRIARFPMPPLSTRTTPEPLAQPPSPPPRTTAAKRGLVLLVEDEPALLRVLMRVLARNHEVLGSADGADAQRQVEARGDQIDLVLCDVILADTNGVALHETLVGIAPRLGSRFAFMTGGGLPGFLVDRIAAIGSPILEKPIEPEQLIAFVAERISRDV